MTRAGTTERIAVLALSFVTVLAAVWPVATHPGVPLFAHDWNWSPYAARSVWTWQLLFSSWIDAGLGEPNSAISVNPLAWLKVVVPVFLSGRDAQIAYLAVSLFAAALGTYRLTRRNLGVPARCAWIAVPALLASPAVFDKIASGQSSYWAGSAAFVWGLSFALDAFETGGMRAALASGACFALASVQLQFLAFAFVVYAAGVAVERRSRAVAVAAAGLAASMTLALPSLFFLALRGPLAGAQISPPYRSWLDALSATPGDAAAGLGYVARYAERASGNDAGVLAATHVAAYALVVAAIAGVVASRRRAARILGLFGAFAWWWMTGIDGAFGAQRAAIFENVASAGFLREFYHAAVPYAVALAALGALGIARLSGRARVLQVPLALAIVAALGAATWSGGLGRVLSFATAPATTGALAAAASGDESRVLFLPAQEPLRIAGDTVGGSDGLDWIDARHHSLFEYYLPPLVAHAAAALADGDARGGARSLARMGVSDVVYRTFVTSDATPPARDRSLSALTAAFGRPRETTPGTFVFAVPHAPLLDGAARLTAQPADLADATPEPSAVYADVPGKDAGAYAAGLVRDEPDPRAGWILRRDVASLDAARVASNAYGVVTLKPGAPVALRGVPAGDAIVWERGRGMRRIGVRAGTLRFAAPDAAAVTEVGETPYPSVRFARAPVYLSRAHDAPWTYRATVSLAGRTALVLRERYDDAWRLDVPPGVTVERHLRADGFANAWIVDGRGRFPIRFVYAYQTAADVLLALSFTAFAATLGGIARWRA